MDLKHRHRIFPVPFPRLHHLYRTGAFCDATVIACNDDDGDDGEKEFHVHRVILSSLSDVLAKRFQEAEAKEQK